MTTADYAAACERQAAEAEDRIKMCCGSSPSCEDCAQDHDDAQMLGVLAAALRKARQRNEADWRIPADVWSITLPTETT